MLQDRVVTQSFMMPATLYLWQLVKAFLGKNWSWGIVLVSFFAVLGLFTDNAVYVAVILFFAAIPVAIFHFFVHKTYPSRCTQTSEKPEGRSRFRRYRVVL